MSSQYSPEWRNACVRPDASLKEVIAALEAAGVQIVLVTDETDHLLGTITDGDLRRAILRGASLDEKARGVMYPKPLVVTADIDSEMVTNLMRLNRIHQVPVVDENNRVISLHVWDEVLALEPKPNSIVVMAGGFGKRLRPYTDNCPKPMLKVNDKPMLEHILLRALGEGFSRFVVTLHYLPETITDYFGDGSHWNAEISYVHEDEPLGTAGALSLLADRPETAFAVVNGDVLTDVRLSDMLAFHQAHNSVATMAIRQHELVNPFGVVHTRGTEITGFEEKPVYRSNINAGVYVLEPEALDVLQKGQRCDMPELFAQLRQKAKATTAYPLHEVWRDVGHPKDLASANEEIPTK